MKPTRILVVDDHKSVRLGIKAFIRSFPTLEWVGEASNGQEAIQRCAELEPDLVLMDVCMPEMDGIEATRQIRQAQPKVRIISLSASHEDEVIQKMMAAGAAGYVFKNDNYDDMASVLGVQQSALNSHFVLIAEDDPHLRSIFAMALKSANFEVRMAANGHDVLAQLEEHIPDLVVLDLGMPEVSGLELIKLIRQKQGLKHVYIIIVTGNHLAESSAEVEMADLFLLKPVDIHDLVRLARRLQTKTGMLSLNQ